MYPGIFIEYLVFVRVSCSNTMSGCLSWMAAIRLFLLQWKPRMFQEMMLRSLPSCPLLSLGCVVLWVLVLSGVLFWLTLAPLPGSSPRPGSIRPLPGPWLGPSLPLTAGLWAVSGSDPGRFA